MKKAAAIVMTFMMLLAALFGTAAASETDLTGTWYLKSARQNGTDVDASLLGMMGMTFVLTVNEDQSAILDFSGSEQEGIWDPEGSFMFGELSIPYEIIDGDLQFMRDGTMMTFSREAPESKETSLTPVVENPQLSDFDGTWNAIIYQMMGMPLPVKLMGADICLIIHDGIAAYTETLYDMNDNYAVADTLEHEFTLEPAEDGTVFVDFAGEEVLSKFTSGASGLTLTLHEDGMITATVPEIEEQMEMLNAMSSQSENDAAQAADDAETAEEEDPEGGSAGGSSGEGGMSAYFLFIRA